jgi:hypothetical protein
MIQINMLVEGLLFYKVKANSVFYVEVIYHMVRIILVNLIIRFQITIHANFFIKPHFNIDKILRVDVLVSSTIKGSIKISLYMVLISIRFMDLLNRSLMNKEQPETKIIFRAQNQIKQNLHNQNNQIFC